jgi:hypothetical protein
VRGLRLVDSLAPVGSRRAPSREMRASYLIRFSLSERMWKLHVRRIRRDARKLRAGETLHLWWHPHNLGANVGGNLRRLAQLIDTVRDAAPADTRFLSMRDSALAELPPHDRLADRTGDPFRQALVPESSFRRP